MCSFEMIIIINQMRKNQELLVVWINPMEKKANGKIRLGFHRGNQGDANF